MVAFNDMRGPDGLFIQSQREDRSKHGVRYRVQGRKSEILFQSNNYAATCEWLEDHREKARLNKLFLGA